MGFQGAAVKGGCLWIGSGSPGVISLLFPWLPDVSLGVKVIFLFFVSMLCHIDLPALLRELLSALKAPIKTSWAYLGVILLFWPGSSRAAGFATGIPEGLEVLVARAAT